MKRLLFVCTGNICRSPSAEAVLRHYLVKEGIAQNYEICSAGTHGYHVGDSPDHRAIKVAQARSISMKGITAQKVSSDDFEEFDHIIAMDRGHLNILKRLKPANSKAQLSLFSQYCSDDSVTDVPDPYYGSMTGFEHVLDILEDGTNGLIKYLERV